MSNKSVILVFFKYFLGYLQPYLTKTKKTKSIKDDLTIDIFIRGLSTKGIFV